MSDQKVDELKVRKIFDTHTTHTYTHIHTHTHTQTEQ